MAFVRPTLKAIIQRVEGDIKGALSITTILRRSFLAAISRAIAGAAHLLHGHMVFISKQIFPDQAELEYLDRWGSIYGLARNPAIFGQFDIDVVFAAAGSVTAGTVWQRTDGTEYTVDADIDAFAPGTITGTVSASVAGAAPNLEVGDTISLQAPIANVEGDADISAVIVEGENEESDELYRQRIVDRIQNPPAGGTINDYKQFALAVSGVTRVWILPSYMGEGTVGISFVEDDDTPSIIPDPAEVAAVQASVDAQKPVTANAFVFAPIENVIDITVEIKPDTTAVRDAITAELEDLFFRESQVKGGYKNLTEFYDGKIPLSKINEAISLADSEDDHNVLVPTSDPEPGTTGGILALGTITFSTLI